MKSCEEFSHPRLLICSCYVEAKDARIRVLTEALLEIRRYVNGQHGRNENHSMVISVMINEALKEPRT